MAIDQRDTLVVQILEFMIEVSVRTLNINFNATLGYGKTPRPASNVS